MPTFQPKAATVTIAGKYEITVDKQDAERVAALTWRPFETAGTYKVTFIAEVGRSRRGPEFQLLASFIMGQLPSKYVYQIDPSKTFDYRRANLRVYQAPAPRHVLRAEKAKP